MLAKLEAGVVPWVKPWNSSGGGFQMPHNAISRKPYRSWNVLMLWMTSEERGYTSQDWLTMKQANELGGRIRKGEKSTWINFWKFLPTRDDPEKTFPLLRLYNVFNVEQCIDLPERLAVNPEPLGRNKVATAIRQYGIDIRFGGDKAFYSAEFDHIRAPKKSQYKTEDDFHSTNFHELIHSTGHKDRLNRLEKTPFGSPEYAREELVAELGSAFLCAEFGIKLERLQHPEYLAHWIGVLKADNQVIMQTASLAQKAADCFMRREFEVAA